MYTAPLTPRVTLPIYNHSKGITCRRADKIHSATITLHNVNTLEVYDYAMRQSAAEQYATAPADSHEQQTATTHFIGTPTRDTPCTSARGGRGGREARFRPTKTPDPYKERRKQLHAQRQEEAAAKRKSGGAAHEAARLASIPEGLDITPPTGTQIELPALEHPLNATKKTENDQLYETEDKDEDLKLSGSQVSCTKEAMQDPREGEIESKRAKTSIAIPATRN
jgi:hypothetical protein